MLRCTMTSILVILGLVSLCVNVAAHKTLTDPGTICSNINPGMVNAIGKFCQFTDIVSAIT